MPKTTIIKLSALIAALAILSGAIPQSAFSSDLEKRTTDEMLLASNKGPILWYVRDPEKKALMEEDMELFGKYNQAMKAKKTRNLIGDCLFYPGLIIMAGGVIGGVFQHAIGLYSEETGYALLIGGTLGGTALIIPGIVFKSKKSKAEKEYMQFVKEKYDIIPILKKEKDGSTRYTLAVNVRF